MNVFLRFACFLCLVGFVSGLVCPVYAVSLKELDEQVQELKRINEAQSKNLATALNQMQEVLSEFQKVHGQVDQSLHFGEEQGKQIGDSQRRLEIIEDKMQLLLTQLEELKAVGLLPASQVKSLNEFEIYQKGLSQINGENFKGAIQTLQSFITNNPKSPYAHNAQYWIGESYFAMRDFTVAVAEFQKVIKKYPQSPKVPPSLLRQGLSFFEMQSFDEAKAFLDKLVSRFPQSSEAELAKEKIMEITKLLELKEKEALEKKISSL